MATLPNFPPAVIGDRLSGLVSQIRDLVVEAASAAPAPSLTGVDDPATAARQTYAARRRRDRYFAANLFGEPAWDILLDLFAAQSEGKRISVTSACIAAQVPTTTALRYLRLLEDEGMIVRRPDPMDQRRIFIELEEDTFQRINAYLADGLGRKE